MTVSFEAHLGISDSTAALHLGRRPAHRGRSPLRNLVEQAASARCAAW
jgi:hypothetical protein